MSEENAAMDVLSPFGLRGIDMPYARIVNDHAVDVCESYPDGLFVSELLAQFVEVPSHIREGWILVNGEWSEPVVVEPPVIDMPQFSPIPSQITALQGLKAIDASGMSEAYTAWANDPARTFLEKAFIDKAQTWQRDNDVIAAAQVALGLTDQQIDDLFSLAATL